MTDHHNKFDREWDVIHNISREKVSFLFYMIGDFGMNVLESLLEIGIATIRDLHLMISDRP